MISAERLPSPGYRDDEPITVTVKTPSACEGVRRALVASFGQVPAMPEELVRLLRELR